VRVGRLGLRVVAGAALPAASELDAKGFEAACVDAFIASWSARGFSPVFIENAAGVLERFLLLLTVPAWEAGPDDVDAVVAQLVANGLAASTRRGYVQAFKDFHRFLTVRKAAEIEATFGVHLLDPVDEFNASRHVGNDSPSQKAPPSPERMDEFFGFLRDRIATARKFGPAGRDYALYRTLYHAGLRADEAASLELSDLHFGRGPFGKIHVRFGKGTRGSGPRVNADRNQERAPVENGSTSVRSYWAAWGLSTGPAITSAAGSATAATIALGAGPSDLGLVRLVRALASFSR
jgi:integrase/recombinase XerD